MNKRSEDIQSFIGKKLHSLLFLEEFVFSRNKFSPPSPSELEFADAVVMLGNVLFICQIKERSAEQSGDEDAERRWFQSKVRTPDIPPLGICPLFASFWCPSDGEVHAKLSAREAR